MLRRAFGKSISVRAPVLIHSGRGEVQVLCPVSEMRNIFAQMTNAGYSCVISEKIGDARPHVAITAEATLPSLDLIRDADEEAEVIAKELSSLGYTVVFTS